MSSRFSPMHQAPATALSPPLRQPPVERSIAGRSYMTSSLELRSGLDVGVLSWAHLPLEVLRELVRLQASWRQGDAPAAPADRA